MSIRGLRTPPPIGRCIYCDTTKGRLTREHIIPRSLGGNVTLQKASCDLHSAITKRNETYAGRRIFQDVRREYGLRFKEPPTHAPMILDGSDEPRLVPVSDHPGALALIVPEPAGLLTGKPPGAPFQMDTWYSHVTTDNAERRERLRQQGLPLVLVQLQLFAFLGTPIYTIVVGQLNEAGFDKLGTAHQILHA